MSKVIITCAVTGSVHTPSMSPYLPITPDEIVADAVAAAEAGAAMIHLHARDPKTGKPTPSPEIFGQFLSRIKQQTDAIINITTGGALGMSMEDRLAAPLHYRPEVVSMNMGSFNFNISHAGSKVTEWKYDWEQPYLEATKNIIVSNTFTQIENAISLLNEHDTRFEYEVYDISHLHTLAYFADKGLIKPPFFIQGIFGILGALAADPQHVMYLKATADRLFGKDCLFSAIGAGRHQLPIITLSAILGGSVRVGLEDSLYSGPKTLATKSADQVSKIRTIVETLGLEIASPTEAREMLQSKGADKVNF
ncbi:3-keto-5-aminohexanoate cleavage protein [Tardibacter chloracetimidivorans]|uniref:3-keto-5-aminohexanoate cleavage protein n=1 Tax=Tardibacter chloracetimidivorans TaxID=1921510 RepID=A0A1L3ZXZ5_9SPHN|nr:3-keto-5-aminohexanoate cleavage protein [Tardibacter chloracetimidivorans]API60502.1 3-keto-5-aminohexanoate cleavage protein [Tardibacter chloracetimidivorans]